MTTEPIKTPIVADIDIEFAVRQCEDQINKANRRAAKAVARREAIAQKSATIKRVVEEIRTAPKKTSEEIQNDADDLFN